MPVIFHLSNHPQITVHLKWEIKKKKKPLGAMNIPYNSNSFFLKTFQATKLKLYKVYIHLFTELFTYWDEWNIQ